MALCKSAIPVGVSRSVPRRVRTKTMDTHKQLESNIWKYGFILVANKRIFVAILGAYYLTIPGVTAQTIGFLLLVGNLAGFLFELPSGYLSDKVGHKQALIVSRLFLVISSLAFLVAKDVLLLAAGSIFLSLGFAFHSGTGSAFMHETLRGLGRDHEYARIMGKLSSIGFAVPIVLMVITPFLISISYQVPFAIALILDCVAVVVAMTLTVPPVPQEQVQEVSATNFAQVMHEGHRLHYLVVALFSGLVMGFVLALNSFRPPYQVFLDIPVIWFGVFLGIGRATASLMLAWSGAIQQHFSPASFFRMQFVLNVLLIMLLGFVATPWLVVTIFIVLNALQWGLSRVSEGYHLDIIRSSPFKATLLSVYAQCYQVVSAVVAMVLGVMIERISYQYSFLVLGALLCAMGLPLYVHIARLYRSGVYDEHRNVHT